MPGDQDARVAQHGPNYLDRCSPVRPPTAPETHPLAQGQATPWAREESPRPAWLPKRGRGRALVPAQSRRIALPSDPPGGARLPNRRSRRKWHSRRENSSLIDS